MGFWNELTYPLIRWRMATAAQIEEAGRPRLVSYLSVSLQSRRPGEIFGEWKVVALDH